MELSLIEEDAKIEIVRGHKNLKYKVKHNGKNMNLVPRYNQWLNLMKTERGENGIITYCAKCYTFIYFDNKNQMYSIDHTCCGSFCYANFCEYCGELYNDASICCLMKCFDIFKYFNYSNYFDTFGLCFMFIPILSLMWLFFSFYMIVHSKRIKKTDDINDKDEGPFETDYGCTIYIISIFFAFTNSIIFCVPYFCTIYFFQLFLMIKIKRQKDEDKANNFRRY